MTVPQFGSKKSGLFSKYGWNPAPDKILAGFSRIWKSVILPDNLSSWIFLKYNSNPIETEQ